MSENLHHKMILVKALTLIENNRAKDAIPFFSQYLAHDPDDYETICWLSFCFSQVKDHAKSLKYATRAIHHDPVRDRAYLFQSKAFCDLERFQESLDSALEAIRLNPESEANLLRLTDAYLDCNKLEEAWETGKKFQALFPHKVSCFIEFSYILMKKEHFEFAQWYLEEALKIDPTNSSALNNLANIYFKRDDNPTKALEYYQLALQANPLDKLALQNIEKVALHNVSLDNLSPSLKYHLNSKRAQAEVVQPKTKIFLVYFLYILFVSIILILISLWRRC